MSDWPAQAPQYVTALPANEGTRMEVYWEVDSTNGVVWHMIYNVTLVKWLFLGGGPLWAQVDANEGTASTTYVGLTTPGPTLTTPGAGLYIVGTGAYAQASAQNLTSSMSYDIGATGAVDADTVGQRAGSTSGTNLITEGARFNRKTIATGQALLAKYKTESGTSTFSKRWMSLLPVSIDPV